MNALRKWMQAQLKREPRHILDNVFFELTLAFSIIACFILLFAC